MQGYGVQLRNFHFPSGYSVNDVRKYLANGTPVFAKFQDQTVSPRITAILRRKYGAILGQPIGTGHWYIILDAQPYRPFV